MKHSPYSGTYEKQSSFNLETQSPNLVNLDKATFLAPLFMAVEINSFCALNAMTIWSARFCKAQVKSLLRALHWVFFVCT